MIFPSRLICLYSLELSFGIYLHLYLLYLWVNKFYPLHQHVSAFSTCFSSCLCYSLSSVSLFFSLNFTATYNSAVVLSSIFVLLYILIRDVNWIKDAVKWRNDNLLAWGRTKKLRRRKCNIKSTHFLVISFVYL